MTVNQPSLKNSFSFFLFFSSREMGISSHDAMLTDYQHEINLFLPLPSASPFLSLLLTSQYACKG